MPNIPSELRQSNEFCQYDHTLFSTLIKEFLWKGTKCVITILSDVSQEMKEKQVKQLNNYKNKIIEVMSHHLKTPLNVISLHIQTLQNQLTDTVSSQSIKIIQNKCQLLESYINDLIDYSNILNNQFFLYVSQFEIREIIEDIMEMFPKDPARGKYLLCFECNEIDPEEKMLSDMTRIKQALVNIINRLTAGDIENN